MSREKQIEEMAKDLGIAFQLAGTTKFGVVAEVLVNAGYRKQEWISVDERLPDEDGEYLTWNGLVYFLIWFNASLGLWNVSEGGDTSSAIRDVTHWMPLPEVPKMKGGAE